METYESFGISRHEPPSMNLCIGLYIVWTIYLMLFGFCKPRHAALAEQTCDLMERSFVPMDKTMISYGIIECGRLVDVKLRNHRFRE
jgi:hypothetical protein